MGVFRGRGAQIDVMAISQTMRDAVRPWETVPIIILDPGPNGAFQRTKDNAAFKWHGMARRQPYRREVITAQVGNPTTKQSVRFQIDFDKDGPIPVIQTDWRVVVLPESLTGIATPDPHMARYQHVIQAADNSSLAWIRTIECQVNTEQVTHWGNSIRSDGAGGWEWVP